jgi:serine/threonine protein kinase
MAGDLVSGMLVGRYRLERRIAKGGMGSVWAARDTRLDREVAIKVLPSGSVDDPAAGQRFEREARAMGRLQHANVVSVFDVGTASLDDSDEMPYLVMELLHGRSLNALLEDGPLPPRRATKILYQVAQALAAAHRAGVIHRDLKPSNIMVTDGGHVKVLDFGLARLTVTEGSFPEETLTTPGIVLGSCPYMSPEQALGDTIGPASDIYSFGSVAYEVLTGNRAFEGGTPVQVMQAVARCSYPPLRQVAPTIPDGLAAVVGRCLQREPDRRYQAAAELARDLEAILDSEESTMTRVPTILQRSGGVVAVAAARRRWMLRVAVAAAVCLVGGLVAGRFAGMAGREPVEPDSGSWAYRELLTAAGSLNSPSWHPSGGEIVVERHQGGRSDVIVVPLDGGDPRVLIEGSSSESFVFPRFSPDGAALAVVRHAGDEMTLQVIPAVGGAPVAEVPNAAHPTWLDAKTILFSRADGGSSAVRSYRLDTGEERLVLGPRESLLWWKTEVSQTGRVALLGGPSDITAGLFVGTLDREPIEQWLAPGQRLSGFSWSPSGASLVASVNRRLVWFRDGRSVPLLPEVVPLQDPALSPDGRTLVAVSPRLSHDLVRVDPDGGGWSCVLCGVPDIGWGSVSRDGVIAYRSTAGSTAKIVVREPSGAEHVVTEMGEEGSCPSFSPDGRRIAYLASRPGSGLDLRVASWEGGQAVTLATGVEGPEYASWSPDGRFLAYAAGTPIQVWVVSAAGGDPRLLTPAGGDYPVWSPDGGSIAYVIWTDETDESQGAWVVPAEGGTPRKVADSPTRLLWSSDGSLLMQLRQQTDRLELWQSRVGEWSWTRRAVLDAGMRPSVHEPYRPLTLDPATGDLIMNRRASADLLTVFEGIDPGRW